ncbi:MAG: alpha/beta fold hydrolase [bacterium]|nr:alpha/beta fold hydrolase [bacterium]
MVYKKNRVATCILCIGVLAAGCTQNTPKYISPESSNAPIEAIKQQPVGASTPIPFGDMTIPGLREKTYNSSLQNLQTISESADYTSYLTNYSSEGLKINALITQPKGEKPPGGWPAIVFVHGYIPPNLYRTTEKYVEYVNYLASNGFVVLKIDLRGHGSSEGEAGSGYYSSDYVLDTLNAYTALENVDFVDKNKIGLWGHSMAGNILLRTFAVKPEIPAVVIWAGAGFTYQDLRDYRINDNSYQAQPSDSPSQRRRQELFNTHGQFDPHKDFWKQVTPSNYLTDLRGAIQLNHAVDDNVVSINYSRNLNNLLDATSVVHELKEYPSGGHNINGSSFTQALQNTIEFYRKHLQ